MYRLYKGLLLLGLMLGGSLIVIQLVSATMESHARSRHPATQVAMPE